MATKKADSEKVEGDDVAGDEAATPAASTVSSSVEPVEVSVTAPPVPAVGGPDFKPNPNVSAADQKIIEERLAAENEARMAGEATPADPAAPKAKTASKNYDKLHELRLEMELASARVQQLEAEGETALMANANQLLADATAKFEEAKKKG